MLIRPVVPHKDFAVGFATVVEKAKGARRLKRTLFVDFKAVIRRIIRAVMDRALYLGDRFSRLEAAICDDGATQMVGYYPDCLHDDWPDGIKRGRGDHYTGWEPDHRDNDFSGYRPSGADGSGTISATLAKL